MTIPGIDKYERLNLVKHEALQPLMRRWILRCLVPLGGMNKFVRSRGFDEDELAMALGFGTWLEDDAVFTRSSIFTLLRKLHRKDAKLIMGAEYSPILKINIDRLSQLVGLTVAERKILEFVIHLFSEPLLNQATNQLGALSTSRIYSALSVLLGVEVSEIRHALSNQGGLVKSGLVTLSRDGSWDMSTKLGLLSEQFADYIVSGDIDPVSLIKDMVQPSREPTLSIEDFQHIDTSLSLLKPYLESALESRRKGINIFIYGAPGTGKSELTRTLAKHLNTELFEIGSEDASGDAITGDQRLRAFRAAQSFFSQRKSLLLFDETEDVFNDGEASFGFKSTAQRRKAWINRTLEENAIPTFWLSNDASCLDAAFIRRFDMVIELPVPPKVQREKIVRANCAEFLDEKSIVHVATAKLIAPALISRSAGVIKALRPALSDADASTAFIQLVNNTLLAQGHPVVPKHNAWALPENYDTDFINANADLGALGKEMLEARTGRLCLFGPPGTGKTAFGHWLAEKLERPLHKRRCSDLISMWVGESERLIASAFREAEQENAVLQIDEVDGFLQDRRNSRQSWEVTMVNEMLTQMESFSGIFIATTNLMEGLDQAALRRFDLKVKFDFLSSSQAWQLLVSTCRMLVLPPPPESLKPYLSKLSCLTPGDFTVVVRQHRFRPIKSADDFIRVLTSEVNLKEGTKAAIGFV